MRRALTRIPFQAAADRTGATGTKRRANRSQNEVAACIARSCTRLSYAAPPCVALVWRIATDAAFSTAGTSTRLASFWSLTNVMKLERRSFGESATLPIEWRRKLAWTMRDHCAEPCGCETDACGWNRNGSSPVDVWKPSSPVQLRYRFSQGTMSGEMVVTVGP